MIPKRKSAVENALVSIERDPMENSWCVRIWIPLLVVMDSVTVENERCVLRDVHPVVYKVFRRIVRRRRPKRCVGTLDLRQTSLRHLKS